MILQNKSLTRTLVVEDNVFVLLIKIRGLYYGVVAGETTGKRNRRWFWAEV